MSSGVTRAVYGSQDGTAATITIETIGFKPRRVVILNEGGLTEGEWTESMPALSMVVHVTAGDMTFVTALGITPLNKGFSLGADLNVNVAGEKIHWVAYE